MVIPSRPQSVPKFAEVTAYTFYPKTKSQLEFLIHDVAVLVPINALGICELFSSFHLNLAEIDQQLFLAKINKVFEGT